VRDPFIGILSGLLVDACHSNIGHDVPLPT
jgi:hypothetical protein